MNRPAKHVVRLSFERAAATYDSAAKVQRRVCQQLALGLPGTLMPALVLDAGCGTGYGLELLALRFPATRRLALDFAPTMLAHSRRLGLPIGGDIERLPLAAASIDLYWSSLAVQWCDLATAVREAARCLRPDGHLALATLGPDTFDELRYAFADTDAYRHTLPCQDEDELRQALTAAGFRAVHIERQPLVVHYPDLKSLLRAVKALGANQVGDGRRPGLLGRAAWQRIEENYENLRRERGLPLTYDVLFCHANS
jgi:malonyl-CoA O-methyltransferase